VRSTEKIREGCDHNVVASSTGMPSPSRHSPRSLSSQFAAEPQSGIQDSDLIERCRRGDLAAFDAIVERHQNRVYNLCFWSLNDPDEAADAAQDVFVRAWRSIAKFRGEAELSTWLHRIALNVIHDAVRRRQRVPLPFSATANSTDDAAAESPSLDPGDPATGPEETVLHHERQQAVRRALAALPAHHRLVLVLFDIQGHSYDEVATLLEVPVGTVKSRLNRARLALRDKLDSCRELFQD
jgi:RNA polymerase sigma-70 factor, ECF subfamily